MFKYFAVTCPSVNLPNGKANPDKQRYLPGTEISFSCFHGFRLDTSRNGHASSADCLPSGSWSHSTPQCIQSNKININFCGTRRV